MSDSYDKNTRLHIAGKDLEQAKFLVTEIGRVAARVANDEDAPLHVHVNSIDLEFKDLFGLASTTGFLDNEVYDKITCGVCYTTQRHILTFISEGISKFQVCMFINTGTSFEIVKRNAVFELLQENRDEVLLENFDKLLIQGLVP